MRAFTLFSAVVIFTILLMGCGKAPLEKGDEAFLQERYGEALKYYLEALKEQPEDPAIKEKIATSYFKQGEKIYKMRRVIPAFEARVETGMGYLPDTLSAKMKKTLSDVFYQLALAYKQAQPENPNQKKIFFDKTLKNLEKALSYNPNNIQAQQALKDFKKENFQEMLDKGINYYKKGKIDPLNYVAADYYLSNALKFDPESKKAEKYLRLARKKALNLLDPGQDVPFAITDQMRKGNQVAYLVVLHNLLGEDITVDASHFYLIDKDGGETVGKASDEFVSPLRQSTLKTDEEIEGVVTFSVKKGKKYVRLELRRGGEVLGYKNLP